MPEVQLSYSLRHITENETNMTHQMEEKRQGTRLTQALSNGQEKIGWISDTNIPR